MVSTEIYLTFLLKLILWNRAVVSLTGTGLEKARPFFCLGTLQCTAYSTNHQSHLPDLLPVVRDLSSRLTFRALKVQHKSDLRKEAEADTNNKYFYNNMSH